jgi:hypothetical protein
VDSCLRAAKDIAASPDDLLHIVLIHELAHHATASAVIKDGYGKRFCWGDDDNYDKDACPSVHEYFAQALAFVSIDQNQGTRLDALRRLSKHQSSMYRTWEVLDAFTQNKVGLCSIRDSLRSQFLALLKTRPQVPEMWDMHKIYNYNE